MSLDHRQDASSHSESYAAWAKQSSVTSTAVNLAVGCITKIRRVEGTMTIGAVETSLVPRIAFANHLFSSVDNDAATWAARSISWSWTSQLWHIVERRFAVCRQGGCVAIAEAFWSEQLAVARTAVNFLVGTVACQH